MVKGKKLCCGVKVKVIAPHNRYRRDIGTIKSGYFDWFVEQFVYVVKMIDSEEPYELKMFYEEELEVVK